MTAAASLVEITATQPPDTVNCASTRPVATNGRKLPVLHKKLPIMSGRRNQNRILSVNKKLLTSIGAKVLRMEIKVMMILKQLSSLAWGSSILARPAQR